jgi:hypothetical protein
VSKLYWPSNRCLSAKLVPTFADRECRVVSALDPYGHILGFLDQSHYCFLQVAQLYSRGWVDAVPDPLFLRRSGSAGSQTRDLWMYSQELWPLDHSSSLVEVELKLQPTVSRPVYLDVGLPSGTCDQIFFSVLTIAGFLMWGALSDDRMDLYFTRTIASGPCQSSPKSRSTHNHILLSHLRLQVPIFISPGTGWPSYISGHWVPFLSPLTILRATVEVF